MQSDNPAEAIINAAGENHCDLILMASHGRCGLDKLIHGSVTDGVLTHTSIPLLVFH